MRFSDIEATSNKSMMTVIHSISNGFVTSAASLKIHLLSRLDYMAFMSAANNDYVVISFFQHVFDFSEVEVDFNSMLMRFAVLLEHICICCWPI